MNRTEKKDLAIIEAATRLFVSNGLERVSVEDIAREAKVSKPTIYSRYKTKEKLFVEILIAECEKQIERMFEPRTQSETLEEFIEKKAKEYLQFITEPWYVKLFKNAIYYSSSFSEIGEAFVLHGPMKGTTKLAEAIRAEIEAGTVKDVDPFVAAEFIITRAKSKSFFNAVLALQQSDVEAGIENEAARITEEFMILFAA